MVCTHYWEPATLHTTIEKMLKDHNLTTYVISVQLVLHITPPSPATGLRSRMRFFNQAQSVVWALHQAVLFPLTLWQRAVHSYTPVHRFPCHHQPVLQCGGTSTAGNWRRGAPSGYSCSREVLWFLLWWSLWWVVRPVAELCALWEVARGALLLYMYRTFTRSVHLGWSLSPSACPQQCDVRLKCPSCHSAQVVINDDSPLPPSVKDHWEKHFTDWVVSENLILKGWNNDLNYTDRILMR